MNPIIYALTCPKCNCPRYIGQTTEPDSRKKCHFRGVKSSDDSIYKKRWVQSLLDQGLTPGFIVILELSDCKDLDPAEIFWIKEMKSRGCPLTNLNNGGGGNRGYKQSAVTIEKRASYFRGVPKSESTKLKISLSLRGRASPKKGRPLTPMELISHAAARVIPPFQDQHGRVYKTIKEASELWSIPPGNIVHCLKRRRKSAGGLVFSYLKTG